MDQLTPNQIAEQEASKAALARLELEKAQPGLSAQRQLPPELAEILGNQEPWTAEDHAWSQGWHDGYYVKEEKRQCPFSDQQLANCWLKGIEDGEHAKYLIEEKISKEEMEEMTGEKKEAA